LRSVTIPSSVEIIGKLCFHMCQSLCEVKFESGSKLREIRHSAFNETSVREVGVPLGCAVLAGSLVKVTCI
jgi:hypothetical protein